MSDESETFIDDTKVNVTLSDDNKQVQLALQDIDLTMWSILSVDAYNLRLRWMPKLAVGSISGTYKSAIKCARITPATCSLFWCKHLLGGFVCRDPLTDRGAGFISCRF